MRLFIISSDGIRILASGGAIALLSMYSAALPSAPASAAEPSTTLSIQPTPQTAARREMTPDELKKIPAIPLYRPGLPPPAAVNPQADTEQPRAAPGGEPDPGADNAARQQLPGAWEQMDSQPLVDPNPQLQQGTDFGTADVFTQYCANCSTSDRVIVPHRAIGVLTNDRGLCSASVISGNNIIVTAAHCCYTPGQGWRSNFRFYPAYRFGDYPPYGSFPWTSARVLTSWTTGGRASG